MANKKDSYSSNLFKYILNNLLELMWKLKEKLSNTKWSGDYELKVSGIFDLYDRNDIV